MANVTIFESAKFGQIRTSGTSDKPLFALADVCKALDLKNSRRVKERLDGDGVTTVNMVSQTTNQHGTTTDQEVAMTFINEPNLYRCIFQSRKKEAREFQDWVFNEVLPQIRKTGQYSNVKMISKQRLTEIITSTAASSFAQLTSVIDAKDRQIVNLNLALAKANDAMHTAESASLGYQSEILDNKISILHHQQTITELQQTIAELQHRLFIVSDAKACLARLLNERDRQQAI